MKSKWTILFCCWILQCFFYFATLYLQLMIHITPDSFELHFNMCPESESFQLQVLELWEKQSYNCRKPIGLVWEWGLCILHTVRPDDQIAFQALTFSSNYNTAVFMKLSKVPLLWSNSMPPCAIMTAHMQTYMLCREHTINTSHTSVSHTKQTERCHFVNQTYWIWNLSYSAANLFTQMKKKMFLVTIAIDFPLQLISDWMRQKMQWEENKLASVWSKANIWISWCKWHESWKSRNISPTKTSPL